MGIIMLVWSVTRKVCPCKGVRKLGGTRWLFQTSIATVALRSNSSVYAMFVQNKSTVKLLGRNMSAIKQGNPQYWLDKWDRGQADWHLKDVNTWLSANIELLTDGREHIKVFIPLCGKCVEIKWLADMGHTVVGVDISSTGFQQFFSDFGLNYTVNSIPGCSGSVYKSADGNIRLYCCSIFQFTNALEGLFDAVWDRAAMVALPPELTKQYHTVLKSLMAPGCQYIVELFDYANPGRADPPFIVPLETIQENFGSEYKVELLERIPSQYFKEKFDASYLNIEMVRISKA